MLSESLAVVCPKLPPQRMVKLVEQLTGAVRKGGAAGGGAQERAARRYHRFVRDNLLESVQTVFPRLCGCLGEAALDNHLTCFLADHKAEDPRFFQLPTEFLLFMQKRLAYQQVLLPLLEYEWTLFEVANRAVTIPSGPDMVSPLAPDSVIGINPSLACVALPFSLGSLQLRCCPISCGRFVYAIYRRADHRLMKVLLSQNDQFFMGILSQNQHPVSYGTVRSEGSVGHLSAAMESWVVRACRQKLIICTVPDGKCHD